MGKTFEYAYDIRKAIVETKPLASVDNFLNFMSQPVFKKIFNQAYIAQRVGWDVERVTDGRFDKNQVMLAMAPALAAPMMLIGEMLYEDLYQNGIKGGQARGEDFRSAFIEGLGGMLEKLSSRYFVYEGILGQEVFKSLATEKKAEGANFAEKVGIFTETMFKQMFTNTLFKYGTYSVGGDLISAKYTDGPSMNSLVEYILNTPTKGRKAAQRISANIYDLGGDVRSDGTIPEDALVNRLKSIVPFLSLTNAQPDLGIL